MEISSLETYTITRESGGGENMKESLKDISMNLHLNTDEVLEGLKTIENRIFQLEAASFNIRNNVKEIEEATINIVNNLKKAEEIQKRI